MSGLLANKTAVVYGGGGAIGAGTMTGAIANLTCGSMVSDIPTLRAYRDRCESRPAFQRALRAQLDAFAQGVI